MPRQMTLVSNKPSIENQKEKKLETVQDLWTSKSYTWSENEIKMITLILYLFF